MCQYKPLIMEIFRKGITLYNITPSDNSFTSEKIGEVSEFELKFKSANFLQFKLNDTCVVDGEEYFLSELPKIEKDNSGEYSYQCTFLSSGKDLKNSLYLFVDQNADESTTYSAKAEFPLTATIDEFISLLCRNLNRNYISKQWDYEISSDVDKNEIKTIDFSGASCLDAIKTICETYEVEWQIIDGVIRIAKEIKYNTQLTLQYDESIIAPIKINYDLKDFANRIFVIGGEKNITSDYGEYLRLPNGLQYIETNRHTNVIVEKHLKFDDIFPHRKGIITNVTFQNQTCVVADTSLDFDINKYLLDGTSAKITFTSGTLLNEEYELLSYNHATKQIRIKRTETDGVFAPSPTISPKVGDTYILTDIRMPESYIYNAEKELLEKAQEKIKEFDVKIDCDIELNEGYLFANKINLKHFQIVRIKDEDLKIDEELRITEVKKYPFSILNKKTEVTLTNYTEKSKFETLIGSLKNDSRKISQNIVNVKKNLTSSNLNIEYNTELSYWEE